MVTRTGPKFEKSGTRTKPGAANIFRSLTDWSPDRAVRGFLRVNELTSFWGLMNLEPAISVQNNSEGRIRSF